jgi:dimethylglycine dehydrogenase
MLEISNYGKFEVTGPGAAEWLSHVMANHVPSVGRIALTPMLNERGKLIGDFTMCRPSEQRFFLIGTLAAEIYYLRWFERHAPPAGVVLRSCATEYVGPSPVPIRALCCRASCAMTCRRRNFHSCLSGAWTSA